MSPASRRSSTGSAVPTGTGNLDQGADVIQPSAVGGDYEIIATLRFATDQQGADRVATNVRQLLARYLQVPFNVPDVFSVVLRRAEEVDE